MAKGTIALGQFRGKVGGQVLRVVEGQQVIQNYQPVVRNPRTTAQEMQRAAMRVLGQMARAFISVLRVSFGGAYATGDFIKANISKNASVLSMLSPSDVTVTYSALNLTKGDAGSLVVVNPGTVDYGSTTHLHVKIPVASYQVAPSIAEANVRVYGVVYCPEMGLAVMSSPATLTTATIDVEVPAAWDGMAVHSWLFATASMNNIDEDAFDRTDLRLPTIVSRAEYGGDGEIE